LRGLADKKFLAVGVLIKLTSSQGTVISANEMDSDMKTLTEQFKVSKREIDHVLLCLVEARLIKRVEENDKINYQLIHDCIGGIVRSWMSAEEVQTKTARGLLNGSRENWVTNHKSNSKLMDLGGLKQVEEHFNDLSMSCDDLEFLCKSSVSCGYFDLISKVVQEGNSSNVLEWVYALYLSGDDGLKFNSTVAIRIGFPEQASYISFFNLPNPLCCIIKILENALNKGFCFLTFPN